MNDDLKTRELLDQSYDFPCPYLFKAIGKASDQFVGHVVQAVRRELPEEMEPPFHSRKSAKGNHVSVSIEPTVQDADQVVAIYQNLKAVEGLEMLL